MLASFLKMVDVAIRKNVGKLWGKIVNGNAPYSSELIRSLPWTKFLQQAYLTGASKAYDEVRRNLPQTERAYGKREYLRGIHTPLDLTDMETKIAGVKEGLANAVALHDGIPLRDEMNKAVEPLKLYVRGEVARLYHLGYETTKDALKSNHETTDMATWQTIVNVRGRWVTTKDDNRVFISEGGEVMPKKDGGGREVYETEKSAPDKPSVPGESSSPKPRLTHDEVRDHVADVRNKWGYKQTMEVKEELGPKFSKGGIEWREFGNCRLDTGHVIIYTKSPWLDEKDVKRLTAHEMMHGMYEKVYQQYERERKEITEKSLSIPNWKDAPIRASGELKPEYHKQYPTYARLWKFIDDYSKLTEEDGITPYSKAYWDDNKAGKVKHHIAVHETLAEMAGLEEMPEQVKLKTSLHYERFFKSVKDEYGVIMGQGKRKRTHKDDVVTNAEKSFGEHTAYFDEDWKPTTPEKAVYIRWWKADGTNGVGRKIDESLVTHGGPGSGNFGHAGRPGKVGGSASSTEGDSTTSKGSYLPDPSTKEGLRAIAKALRRAMAKACKTSTGMCVDVVEALRHVYPEAEEWMGLYKGHKDKEHAIAKLGGRYVDITSDQFGGPKILLKKSLSEGEYPKFYQLPSGKPSRRPEVMKVVKQFKKNLKEITQNVFCPTGPGGGVDPTCKADKSGVSSTKLGGRVQRAPNLDQVSQLVIGKGLEGRSAGVSGRQLTDDDIRAIGFSPEGTTVLASGSRGGELSFYTESESRNAQGLPDLTASRTIRKPWFAPLTCYNGGVIVEGKYKGRGLELFNAQVKTLQALGVKRIVASAAGDAETARTNPRNGTGYYVWPRFGYSGIMSSKQIAALPEEIQKALKGKRDIRDLFDLPGGAEAWKAHGSSIKVHFDLSPGSRNMRALEAYKIERDSRAKRTVTNFDPDQPRDDRGRWVEGSGATKDDVKESETRLLNKMREFFRGENTTTKARQYLGQVKDFFPGHERLNPKTAQTHVFFEPTLKGDAAAQVKDNVVEVGPQMFGGRGTSGSSGDTFVHEIEHLEDRYKGIPSQEFTPRLRQMLREMDDPQEAINFLRKASGQDEAEAHVKSYFLHHPGYDLTDDDVKLAADALIKKARKLWEKPS